MQDYKSLSVTVIVCYILVNTQTHSFWLVILLARLAKLKICRIWCAFNLEILHKNHRHTLHFILWSVCSTAPSSTPAQSLPGWHAEQQQHRSLELASPSPCSSYNAESTTSIYLQQPVTSTTTQHYSDISKHSLRRFCVTVLSASAQYAITRQTNAAVRK